jgi:hypothetical protein
LNFLWSKKFIWTNLLILIFIKVALSYSGVELTALLGGISPFTKEDVVAQVNDARRKSGLNELRESSVLNTAAYQKLQDMIDGQYFAHYSPSGISPWYWIESGKYNYSYAGENLAIGFLSAKSVTEAWLNSPSHRVNLLNSKYTEIGVAVAPGKIKNDEGILVVQLFATPRANPKSITNTKTGLVPTASPGSISAKTAVTKFNNSEVAGTKIERPVILNLANQTPVLAKTSQILNSGFLIYSFLVILACATMALLVENKKELVLKSLPNVAVFLLAATVPAIEITKRALII